MAIIGLLTINQLSRNIKKIKKMPHIKRFLFKISVISSGSDNTLPILSKGGWYCGSICWINFIWSEMYSKIENDTSSILLVSSKVSLHKQKLAKFNHANSFWPHNSSTIAFLKLIEG